jgi:hypothetical protein
MNRRLTKIAFLTFAAAAVILVPSTRADDTTAAATAAAAPASPSGPLKFHGPITSVDTNAMTFVVGDQTFTITDESEIKKNGKIATIADAFVGEPAHGSYTKDADGKLDVTKVRFGKKAGGKHKKSTSSDTDTTSPATADTNSPPASPQQ